MTDAGTRLPEDPEALKTMLVAREAEIARLYQIIKELQRRRFGRRAESLPMDQLLLVSFGALTRLDWWRSRR